VFCWRDGLFVSAEILAERKLTQSDHLEKSPRDETWVFQYGSGKNPESLVNKPKISKPRKPKWKVKSVLIFLFDIKVFIDYAFRFFITTN
jgi:hypothetical protein